MLDLKTGNMAIVRVLSALSASGLQAQESAQMKGTVEGRRRPGTVAQSSRSGP
jgi:hypothetical protein